MSILDVLVNCTWSGWGKWSSCSLDCGEGKQTRSRTKMTEAANGGIECEEDILDTQICNMKECTGMKALVFESML